MCMLLVQYNTENNFTAITAIRLHFHAFESINLKLCFDWKKEFLESILMELHKFHSQQHFLNSHYQNTCKLLESWIRITANTIVPYFTDTYRYVKDADYLCP